MRTYSSFTPVSINESLLNEMFIRGIASPKNGDNILAYKQHIWSWNDSASFNSIVGEINNIFSSTLSKPDDIDSWEETHPDVLIGKIDGNELSLPDRKYQPDVSSPLLKKTLKFLKLKGIKKFVFIHRSKYSSAPIVEPEAFSIEVSNYKKGITDKFYHGTSYTSLLKMVSKGLVAMPNKSNFGELAHKDKVFVTTDLIKAKFHAKTAANQFRYGAEVIIKLEIPDKNNLITDYDVAIDLLGNNDPISRSHDYSDLASTMGKFSKGIEDLKKRYGSKIGDLSSHLGMYGYKGRIPYSYFKSILLDEVSIKRFIAYQTWGDNDNYFPKPTNGRYISVKPNELESFINKLTITVDEELTILHKQ